MVLNAKVKIFDTLIGCLQDIFENQTKIDEYIGKNVSNLATEMLSLPWK